MAIKAALAVSSSGGSSERVELRRYVQARNSPFPFVRKNPGYGSYVSALQRDHAVIVNSRPKWPERQIPNIHVFCVLTHTDRTMRGAGLAFRSWQGKLGYGLPILSGPLAGQSPRDHSKKLIVFYSEDLERWKIDEVSPGCACFVQSDPFINLPCARTHHPRPRAYW